MIKHTSVKYKQWVIRDKLLNIMKRDEYWDVNLEEASKLFYDSPIGAWFYHPTQTNLTMEERLDKNIIINIGVIVVGKPKSLRFYTIRLTKDLKWGVIQSNITDNEKKYKVTCDDIDGIVPRLGLDTKLGLKKTKNIEVFEVMKQITRYRHESFFKKLVDLHKSNNEINTNNIKNNDTLFNNNNKSITELANELTQIYKRITNRNNDVLELENQIKAEYNKIMKGTTLNTNIIPNDNMKHLQNKRRKLNHQNIDELSVFDARRILYSFSCKDGVVVPTKNKYTEKEQEKLRQIAEPTDNEKYIYKIN